MKKEIITKVIPFIVLNDLKHTYLDHGEANGYVAVGPDNQYYGKTYEEFDDIDTVEVHGGITYGEPVICGDLNAMCISKIKPEYIGRRTPLLEKAVYLTLDNSIPDDWWILGFDTFHWRDDRKEQNLDYCIHETLKLAKQLSTGKIYLGQ